MKSSTRRKFACWRGSNSKSSTIRSEISEKIVEQADNYLQSLVENKTFIGSVLLARNDEILLIKGYGCSEYTCHEQNTSQTIYRIGSVTKPFTAVLTLKLVERKQLSLNDQLSRFLPDYPHAQEIRIKHLLSNTSGIEDYTEMDIFEEKCGQHLSFEQLIDFFKNEPLQFRPGSKYSYSNSNFILLGYLIEKITGKSYEKNLREYILEPCLMTSTSYDCDNPAPTRGRRACGYICNQDSNGFETCRFIDMSAARSAGGISSTIEDLYRFDRFLYGETILRDKMKKIMFKPVREHYALGWEIHRLKHGRIRQRHVGQIFGFISCLARFPADNACIIVLSNFEQTSIDALLERLTEILFQEK